MKRDEDLRHADPERADRLTCRHCGAQSPVRADGICRACGEHVRAERPRRDGMLSSTLRAKQWMPPACVDCGRETHRRTRVSLVCPVLVRADSESVGCLFAGLLLPPFFPWLLRSALKPAPRAQVELKVPQCEECRRRGKPEVLAGSYEESSLTIRTHDRFRERLTRGPDLTEARRRREQP